MEQPQPATPSEAPKETSDWSDIFECLAQRLQQELGLNDSSVANTRDDTEEGMPLVILDAQRDLEVIHLSTSFAMSTGWQREAILGKRGIDFLRLRPDAVHDALNCQAWQELVGSQHSLLEHAAVAPCPEPATALLVAAHASGAAFWTIADAVPITPQPGCRCRYLALLFILLDAPVPRAIFCGCGAAAGEESADAADGASGAVVAAFMETIRGDLVRARRELAQELAQEIAQQLQETGATEMPQDVSLGVLAQAADEVRKEIMHIHEDALEGDHYVPKLGWKSVEAFEARPEVLRRIDGEVHGLRTAWQISIDDAARFASQPLTYCIVDPSGVDQPLVFVSDGFKELTGYDKCWALGRNCRFAQPNARALNARINTPELQRIKEFCQERREGHMLSLMLNERADGRHFWNLLYLKHDFSSEGAGAGPPHGWYIFAVMTSIVLQKDALDMLILQELGGAGSGVGALEMLRDAMRQHEQQLIPSGASPLRLIGEVSTAWVRDVGQSLTSFWEHGHFVPRIGTVSALNFSGMWPLIVDASGSYLEDLLGAPAEGRSAWRANRDPSLICAVADPLGMDCPLAFLSRGFQESMGYNAGFCLGRNCRFLQPSTSGMNEVLNGEELVRMREFSLLRGREASGSEALLTLLLNQRRSGERFWSLCHQTHVVVGQAPYILAIYAVLSDMPMPGFLRSIAASEAAVEQDSAGAMRYCQHLGARLASLRLELRARWTELAAATAAAAAAAEEVIVISTAGPTVQKTASMKVLAAQATEALGAFLETCGEEFGTEVGSIPTAEL